MHPVLFTLGPLSLYSYGLMLAIGYCAALFLATRRARAIGLDPSRVQSVALVALLAGIVGARAAYVLLYWQEYRQNPWEILRLDHGGLVFYGGLGAGVLAGLWSFKRFSLPVWKTMDLMLPPLVLAHAIGRVGCFFNGCCYGKPTNLPWAVAFPIEGIPRHPTQLYESAALLLLFFILKILEKRELPPGTVTFAYGFLYTSWRFLIEFLRGDNPRVFGDLTIFQLVSLPLSLIFLAFFLQRFKHQASGVKHASYRSG